MPSHQSGLVLTLPWARSHDHVPSNTATGFLWVLLLLTVVRGVLYAVLNPPFASPDEGDHFKYVAYLATGGASGDKGREYYQPVFYYALMAPAFWATAGQPILLQLMAIRLSSLVFLLGTVWLAWRTARLVLPDCPAFAIGVASIVALSPENTVVAASANNDAAGNFMGALLALLSAQLMLQPKPTTALLALPAIGLALITKITLLAMTLACTIALVTYLLHIVRPRSWLRMLGLLALTVIAMGIISQVGSGGRTLHRISSVLSAAGNWQQSITQVVAAGRWPWVYQFKTFWATFLGDTAQPAVGWYLLLAAFVSFAAVGHLRWARQVVAMPRPRLGRQDLVGVVFLVGLFLQWMISVTYLVLYTPDAIGHIWFRSEWSVQGRYLLPALVPFSVLVVSGLMRLAPSHAKRWLPVVIPVLMLAFDVNSLLSLLTYYTWPPQYDW